MLRLFYYLFWGWGMGKDFLPRAKGWDDCPLKSSFQLLFLQPQGFCTAYSAYSSGCWLLFQVSDELLFFGKPSQPLPRAAASNTVLIPPTLSTIVCDFAIYICPH